MATASTGTLFHFLRRIAADVAQPDGTLLYRFRAARDEDAFAALVRRHGPMVLGVCRRVLRGRPEAEDAFQATFLVLAQKAGSIARPDCLAGWLYGVAYRTALKARSQAARRDARERLGEPLPEVEAPAWPGGGDPGADWRLILDEEVGFLPEKYRLPMLLCYLEGRTNEEAADVLGCPKGTIHSRLAWARARLRERLMRRGVFLSAGGVSALLTQTASAVPPALLASLVESASHGTLADVSSQVTLLTQGMMRMFWLSKLKVICGVVLVLALLGLGTSVLLPERGGNGPRGLEAGEKPERAKAPPALLAGDAGEKKEPKKEDKLLPPEVRKAIDAGLDFLQREQAADGSWRLTGGGDVHIAATSICGLAFLAGDVVPGKGKRGETVEKALKFVLSREDRKRPGFFGEATSMYGQGFATLFIAEAVARLPEPKLKKEITAALERAVALTLKAQNKAGGWRYQPEPRDADITVTCTQIKALLAARRAGVNVPQEALDRAAAFVTSCQNPDDGGYRYMPTGGATNVPRSAAAVASLLGCGKAGDESVKKGVAHLKRLGPDGALRPERTHYFYSRYQVAEAAWRMGDDVEAWFAGLQKDLLRKEGGNFAGDHWSDVTYGTHYATGMALVALQVPRNKLAVLKK